LQPDGFKLIARSKFREKQFLLITQHAKVFCQAGWWHRRCLKALENHKGVDDAFLPVRGFISIPPGDRRELGPKPFPAPVMYL
jgi:hypothetical protein